jgi:hypothetical protein
MNTITIISLLLQTDVLHIKNENRLQFFKHLMAELLHVQIFHVIKFL